MDIGWDANRATQVIKHKALADAQSVGEARRCWPPSVASPPPRLPRYIVPVYGGSCGACAAVGAEEGALERRAGLGLLLASCGLPQVRSWKSSCSGLACCHPSARRMHPRCPSYRVRVSLPPGFLMVDPLPSLKLPLTLELLPLSSTIQRGQRGQIRQMGLQLALPLRRAATRVVPSVFGTSLDLNGSRRRWMLDPPN